MIEVSGASVRSSVQEVHGGLDHESSAVATLSLIRAALGRLRSATSDDQALAIVAECAAECFGDALLIVSAKRAENASWQWSIGLNRGIVPNERFTPHLSDLPYLQERVTARNGFDGFIHVRHAIGHIYSQFDREILAAIADVASLALS